MKEELQQKEVRVNNNLKWVVDQLLPCLIKKEEVQRQIDSQSIQSLKGIPSRPVIPNWWHVYHQWEAGRI